jgi:ubiquinone/menaquinone biosynthesis C-methylase UbiE
MVGEQHARVLDLASGSGSFTRMLADAGHEVFGIDRDPAQVASLAERLGTQLHVAARVEALPFLACHFDVVTASQTLHPDWPSPRSPEC